MWDKVRLAARRYIKATAIAYRQDRAHGVYCHKTYHTGALGGEPMKFTPRNMDVMSKVNQASLRGYKEAESQLIRELKEALKPLAPWFPNTEPGSIYLLDNGCLLEIWLMYGQARAYYKRDWLTWKNLPTLYTVPPPYKSLSRNK